MSEYQPVPVSEAMVLSSRYHKCVVVIVAVDEGAGLTHVTTYGSRAELKVRAARLGEVLAKAAGMDLGKATTFEDFRTLAAADRAAENEALHRRVAELEALLAGRPAE